MIPSLGTKGIAEELVDTSTREVVEELADVPESSWMH